MTRPTHRTAAPSGRPRDGFTLVELLVVFVVLSILIALLLPAINGAVRTAKNTAAQAELTRLGAALAAFKNKYGDFPPSRVILSENGLFPTDSTVVIPGATNQTDMTYGQLAQRSLNYMRKFFPKAEFRSAKDAPRWPAGSQQWYDFNGNGVQDLTPYVLEGHQSLVFFLGGLPSLDDDNQMYGYAMTGFAKNPSNPFTPLTGGTQFRSDNREAPFFEFDPNRLVKDPHRLVDISGKALSKHIPGYIDSLNGASSLGDDFITFIAYFSSYGNNAYDPNDVNFPTEKDSSGTPAVSLAYKVRYPTSDADDKHLCISPGPNPYTSNSTYDAGASYLANFINPQSYQLISPGIDGQYGPGGRYQANTAGQALPVDGPNLKNTADLNIRIRERDNLTNFHGGPLD